MISIIVVIALGHLFGMIRDEVMLSAVSGLLTASIMECIIVSSTLYLIRIVTFNALLTDLY